MSVVMRRLIWWTLVASAPYAAMAQTTLNWQQVRARFEASNPALRAGQIDIEESKANELSAFLRPNPGASFKIGRAHV
jgi:outer membrane protein, heavy metal efflux system